MLWIYMILFCSASVYLPVHYHMEIVSTSKRCKICMLSNRGRQNGSYVQCTQRCTVSSNLICPMTVGGRGGV